MKVAALLSGNLRTWQFCNSDWLQECDKVFAFVYAEKYCYRPFIRDNMAGYREEVISLFSLDSPFELIQVNSSNLSLPYEDKIDVRLKEFINIYRQFGNLYFHLDYLFKHHNLDQYDCLIRTRYDVSFETQLEKIFEFPLEEDEIILEEETFCFTGTTRDGKILRFNGDPKLNLYQLSDSEVKCIDKGILLSDWTIVGKPIHLFKLCIFILKNFISPSSDDVTRACPHGMIETFLRQEKLKLRFHRFGSLIRFHPGIKPKIPRVHIIVSGFSLQLPFAEDDFPDFEFTFSFWGKQNFSHHGTVLQHNSSKFDQLKKYSSLCTKMPYFIGENTLGYSLALWYLWDQIPIHAEDYDLIVYWRTSCTFCPQELYPVLLQSFKEEKVFLPKWKITDKMKNCSEYTNTQEKLSEINQNYNQTSEKIVDSYLKMLFQGTSDFLFLGPSQLIKKINPYQEWSSVIQNSELQLTASSLFVKAIKDIPVKHFDLDYDWFDPEIYVPKESSKRT